MAKTGLYSKMLIYFFAFIVIEISGADLNREKNSVECEHEYSCLDCTTVRICKRKYNGTFTRWFDFQCGNSTPFCDSLSGTCQTATNDVTCAPKATDFACPMNGYFPHPSNCHKYYICIKGTAYAFDCGASYYSIKSENCQYSAACHSVNCTGKSGLKVPYPADSSFFGYCFNNTVIGFNKCPGKFQLDSDGQRCIPVCISEGYQGDPYDCRGYYKCSRTLFSASLKLTYHKCLDGEYFDTLNSQCGANISCNKVGYF